MPHGALAVTERVAETVGADEQDGARFEDEGQGVDTRRDEGQRVHRGRQEPVRPGRLSAAQRMDAVVPELPHAGVAHPDHGHLHPAFGGCGRTGDQGRAQQLGRLLHPRLLLKMQKAAGLLAQLPVHRGQQLVPVGDEAALVPHLRQHLVDRAAAGQL